ncbi:MAG: DUF2283 domain-containing protein [Planctomycetota bacterium]|jgi:uncharacterized protein YuzE
MKVRYFEDTDTALVEIGTTAAHETRELTPDVYVDLDAEGRVVSITIEHASRQGDSSEFTFERVAASPSVLRQH